MSHREVRLGGRGTEWPKAPTLGRQVSAWGLLNVVEHLLFSLFSATLTLDFDIILGSI